MSDAAPPPPPGPVPRVLLDGLAFGESVRWHDGRVWVCDWVDGDVLSVASDGSDRRVEAHVDGFPVCIDWSADGELLVVSGRTGRLLRRTADGDLVEVADLTGLSPHPWNEVAAHPGGWAYVDGIGFDMMGGQPAEPAHGERPGVPDHPAGRQAELGIGHLTLHFERRAHRAEPAPEHDGHPRRRAEAVAERGGDRVDLEELIARRHGPSVGAPAPRGPGGAPPGLGGLAGFPPGFGVCGRGAAKPWSVRYSAALTHPVASVSPTRRRGVLAGATASPVVGTR